MKKAWHSPSVPWPHAEEGIASRIPASLRGGLFSARVLGLVFLCFAAGGRAQVPQLIGFQGRVTAGGIPFTGEGHFKFALINGDGRYTLWSNDGTGSGGSEPAQAVPLPVSQGSYSVLLGNPALPHMTAIPHTVFGNAGVQLRVWFDDGRHGSQRLAPDQTVAAVGYAMMSATVPDGAITHAKLSPEALAPLTAALDDLAQRMERNVPPGGTLVSALPEDPDYLARGLVPFMTVPGPAWVAGATSAALLPRYGHAAAWTGQEWIVWGGNLNAGTVSGAGARYRPDTDSWHELPGADAPAARSGHTAVWTGEEFLVWGGYAGGSYLGGGGGYEPSGQRWRTLSPTAAPVEREGHVAVWTGRQMLVWGGRNAGGVLGDGAAYDPVDDTWTPLPSAGAPSARVAATAVWTGGSLLIWGGEGVDGCLRSGGELRFDAGGAPSHWLEMSRDQAPSERRDHGAVWTSRTLLVWGGRGPAGVLGDGAAYSPATDTWSSTAPTGAPSARSGHAAVWTGLELLVVGGLDDTGELASGGAYNPATGTWRPLTTAGGPAARSGATAVWTGGELLLFGGRYQGQSLAALQRLNPQPTWYFYRRP